MTGELYDSDHVAKLIETYCEQHRIDEADFAVLVGVHPAHLSRIKKGKMCSPEILAKIAALGAVSLRELIRDIPERFKQELCEKGRLKGLPVSI